MDPALMSTERLEAELVAHAAWETAALATMIPLLAEFDRCQAWASWECRSAQHWLSWKCGLGYTAATERLRVAHAFPVLPAIAGAFAQGRLSWSKVRELTRVATPADEGRWCELAQYATAAQIARLTAAARKVTANTPPTQGNDGRSLDATRPASSPGCDHAGRFEAHHVIERAKGGRTRLSNLTRICWHHHRMIHLHHLIITLHPNPTITVTTRTGALIDRPLPDLTFHTEPPVDPDRLGGWQGDPLHINDCLNAIGIT